MTFSIRTSQSWSLIRCGVSGRRRVVEDDSCACLGAMWAVVAFAETKQSSVPEVTGEPWAWTTPLAALSFYSSSAMVYT